MSLAQRTAYAIGRVAIFLNDVVDRIHPDWYPRLPLHAFEHESDDLLTIRNTHTIPFRPNVPRVQPPDEDREATERMARRCIPPRAPVSERRVFCVGDKQVSVTPPVGCYWQQGGNG